MLGSWATLKERSKNEVHDNIELLLYIFQSQTQFEQSSTLSNSNYIKVFKIYLLKLLRKFVVNETLLFPSTKTKTEKLYYQILQ